MKKYLSNLMNEIKKWNPKDSGTIFLEQAIREWELQNGNRDRDREIDSNK